MKIFFDKENAVIFGLKEGIILEYFKFWILKNKKANKNVIDGHVWMYITCEELSKHFGFMSEQTVRNTINSLIKQGVLISGNYNKVRFDRTLWYAFADEEKFIS